MDFIVKNNEKSSKLTLYSFNGANFDNHFIVDYILNSDFELC
jgi:uncharacterized protein YprB with RNaseH-like and TPR domain